MENKSIMTSKYIANKLAQLGDVVECPVCLAPFRKRQYSQAFCCIECKDKYWNAMRSRSKSENTSDDEKYDSNLSDALLSNYVENINQ